MSEPCMNKDCGAYFVSIPTHCMFKEDHLVSSCANYTTTPTVSISEAELTDLKAKLARAGELMSGVGNHVCIGCEWNMNRHDLCEKAEAKGDCIVSEIETFLQSIGDSDAD